MAGTRSESNAVGNSKYTDLNMTFYPTQIDSKIAGNAGYNPNMKGFWSLGDKNLPAGTTPDINFAEHVNALADAVMAIQRILGINPHIDNKGGNTDGTVSTRIAGVENKDAYYDKRYGGQTWTPELGQTILTHTHGGGLGEAPKIRLGSDVSGRLSKTYIDLTQETGLTGDDISMSRSSSTKVSDAIKDKLSISQGGTVSGPVEFKDRLNSRMHKEWDAEDVSGGTLITDYNCLIGKARRASGTSSTNFLQGNVTNLLSGKYVLGVRAKVNTLSTENVLSLYFGDHNGTSVVSRGTKYIKGTDFRTANEYKMFYFVFDHEILTVDGISVVHVIKPPTTGSVDVTFDYAFITPVHPAVFDM